MNPEIGVLSVNVNTTSRKPKQTIFNSRRVRSRVKQNLWSNRYIYLMVLPVVIYFVLLKYMPMWFLRSAFYDYKLLRGFDSKFVGLKWFERLFTNPNLMTYIGNTLSSTLPRSSFCSRRRWSLLWRLRNCAAAAL